MTNKIRNRIPVGFKADSEIWIFISAIIIGIIRSLLFFYVYTVDYNSLFEFVNGEKILISGSYMTYFYEIIDGCFNGFLIAIFIFIFLIFYHYMYHFKDSKSIYTMKRLPNKSELHIRCLSVPLTGIALSAALSIGLLLAFYFYYMAKTPPECLYPDQWEKLLTKIIYGGKRL